MREDLRGVPLGQLRNGEDGQGEDEVEEVEGGQPDQQLVEVAPHLRAGQDEDGQHVAWRKSIREGYVASSRRGTVG